MSIGKMIADARKRKGMTQNDLAFVTNYSREMIAKMENGTRKIQKETLPQISQSIDDPQFFFESWSYSAGVVSIPYFNGDYIDQHPVSMKMLVEKETHEAFQAIEQINWFKPAKAHTEAEREDIKKLLIETLDAAASMINLVALICKEYKFSMKDIFQTWKMTLKIRKYNK